MIYIPNLSKLGSCLAAYHPTSRENVTEVLFIVVGVGVATC